jgi:hypothetical protein
VKVLTLRVPFLVVLAVLSVSCSGQRIVNTDEPPAATPATSPLPPPPPPPSNRHLVDAFDYVGHPEGGTAYFFTSPSGSWACAIVPRVKAGCQSATGWPSALGVTGEPDSVPDAAGEDVPPNAVVVNREGDAHFAALEQPEFALDPESANVLKFNKILAAAGFRCNVQESGVSCLSEFSGKGFTFSADGFMPQYTEVPADAP